MLGSSFEQNGLIPCPGVAPSQSNTPEESRKGGAVVRNCTSLIGIWNKNTLCIAIKNLNWGVGGAHL